MTSQAEVTVQLANGVVRGLDGATIWTDDRFPYSIQARDGWCLLLPPSSAESPVLLGELVSLFVENFSHRCDGFGLWHDTENGRYVISALRGARTLASATEVALTAGQRSFYDIDRGQVVEVA
jgi:hypothetical protein